MQVLQGSRTLAEQATAMERYIKQFQVLGDESLFHAYVETHDRFQQVAHNLCRHYSRCGAGATACGADHERAEPVRDRAGPSASAGPFTALTPEFTTLKELARAIRAENDKLTDRDTEVMREEVATVQRLFVWQAVGLIFGAVVFSAIFVGLIARPIRQIDSAIQRLGAGEFGTAIQIAGPHDLQYLGSG